MKKISVSAPGKIMLLGEHAVLYRYPCIVTAISKRITVSIGTYKEKTVKVYQKSSPNITEEKTFSTVGKGEVQKELRYVEHGVRNFLEIFRSRKGVDISIDSAFSSLYGFGSSSAVTVALIKCLAEFYGIPLSDKELFNISYKTVLDVQKKGSGFDVASSIWGGTLYFKNKGATIIQLQKPFEALPLVITYSGSKAETVSMIDRVIKQRDHNRSFIDNLFSDIGYCVSDAKEAILKKDWYSLGSAMDRNQKALCFLGVSTRKLDTMIQAAKKAGALGAKLSGAGGGDCMIAILDGREQFVSKQISKVGEIVRATPNEIGVRIERSMV